MGDAAQVDAAVEAALAAQPAWAAATPADRFTALETGRGGADRARSTELGELLVARGGQAAGPKASPRSSGRRGSSSSSPARRCGRRASTCARSVPASTSTCSASRWVSWASSRRGTSRSRSRPGRSPRRSPTGTRSCSSRPSSSPPAVGARRDPVARRSSAGHVQLRERRRRDRSASGWSTIRRSEASRSPDRRRWDGRSRWRARIGSPGRSSRWAGRTRSSSWTMPIWTSRSTVPCRARSSRRASDARRARG